MSHLLFLLANPDGPCSLCGGSGHLVAACCFEVHAGSRRWVYNGIELCPTCLEREGTDAGRRVVRKVCREMVDAYTGARTALERRNRREAQAYGVHLVAAAGRGCRFPPMWLWRWVAREK